MGAQAYSLIKLVHFKPEEIAIEIGSERGEGSTKWLSEYCVQKQIKFYSVDIFPRTEQTIVDTGENYLQNNNQPIKFAYLDNFDYIFEGYESAPWIKEQSEEYAKLNLKLNNKNSEKAHLLQAQLVHKNASGGCVLVIDDTFYLDGFKGKGATAVPWLLKNNWQVINEVGESIENYVALRRNYNDRNRN